MTPGSRPCARCAYPFSAHNIADLGCPNFDPATGRLLNWHHGTHFLDSRQCKHCGTDMLFKKVTAGVEHWECPKCYIREPRQEVSWNALEGYVFSNAVGPTPDISIAAMEEAQRKVERIVHTPTYCKDCGDATWYCVCDERKHRFR